MIIYQEDKTRFLRDVDDNKIDDAVEAAYRRKIGHGTSSREILSWRNSLPYMASVIRDDHFPSDTGISIECHIPNSAKRIDFIVSGKDAADREQAVIVELKQWEIVRRTDMDGIVNTFVGGRNCDKEHPSYQAWSYASLLENFNAEIEDSDICLKPCAYLHNCTDGTDLLHPHYELYLAKAPLFLKADTIRLREFIKRFIVKGDSDNVMYRIDRGRIRPSKTLADAVVGMLHGNEEFVLIDDQKLVFETGLQLATKQHTKKQVLIVEGGPGTGKSVVAINLLARLTGSQYLVQYVSKNSAPRAVYADKLTGHRRRIEISHLFKGSGSYMELPSVPFDCLIVDEAHRLNEKSGLYGNEGENQIKEIIQASRSSIFFIDEDQKVTFRDIGDKEAIRDWAIKAGAEITELTLESQFRCNGSNGYLAWVDHTIQIRETANPTLEGIDYDFQIFDNPSELRDAIVARNGTNRARLVAGYCWKWVTKKHPQLWDIEFPEFNFRMRWNLTDDGSLWMVAKESVNQIGCIHTAQGLEVDYIGVIIGPDLKVDFEGNILTDPSKRASSDKSLNGWRKAAKNDPEGTLKRTDTLIKNTYRTLMTRGMKGCYVYATDPLMREYLKEASKRPIQTSSI